MLPTTFQTEVVVDRKILIDCLSAERSSTSACTQTLVWSSYYTSSSTIQSAWYKCMYPNTNLIQYLEWYYSVSHGQTSLMQVTLQLRIHHYNIWQYKANFYLQEWWFAMSQTAAPDCDQSRMQWDVPPMGWKHVMLIALLLQFSHTWPNPINSLVITYMYLGPLHRGLPSAGLLMHVGKVGGSSWSEWSEQNYLWICLTK